LILPAVDTLKLLREDSIESQNKAVPFRFGTDIEVDLNPDNSGIWKSLPNGDKLWQLAIESKKAYSLNLIFSNYHLPYGTKLYIYNKEKTSILGAFTDKNNRDDLSFATTIIKGSYIILEYFEPAEINIRKAPVMPTNYKEVLNISSIIHGYKNLFKIAKGFGGSGKCNININCPEGDNFQELKRAVAMIVTDKGKRICSGTLLNNAKADGTPYLLTARTALMEKLLIP